MKGNQFKKPIFKMKIVAIIQARTGSTRLPGKVLLKLAGKTMLSQVIERVKRAKKIDEIIIATTTSKKDEVVIKIAKAENVKFFSGNENDVLDRYYNAAKKFEADIIARITSDCPLIDPKIIDNTIELFEKEKADYASNVFERTFPRGLDVEIFSFKALEKAWKEAKENVYREHVTSYIYGNPKMFKLASLTAEKKFFAPELRFCVDTKEDFELMKKIYDKLYRNGFVNSEDAVVFVKKEKLYKINQSVEQKSHPKIRQKTSEKIVVFRLDADEKIGTGHLMRCFALAEKLKARNVFVLKKMRGTNNKIAEIVKNKGFEILFIDFSDEKNEIEKLKELNAELNSSAIVVDVYNRSENYFYELKNFGRLIVIDDFAKLQLDADIIVNSNVFAKNMDYGNCSGRLLLGPKYALLRTEFENIKKRKIHGQVKTILIVFGGSDPNNATIKALRALREVKFLKIIVVGKLFSNIPELKEELRNHQHLLYVGAHNVSELMQKADLAISGAGTTMLELACTGLPALSIVQAENQKLVAEEFEKQGTSINLGNDINPLILRKKILELKNYALREKMSASGQKLVDGKGAERVAEEIMGLI